MIFNILDNTTELWMTKYITGGIFSSGGATLYKNPSDQTVQRSRADQNTFDGFAPVWQKNIQIVENEKRNKRLSTWENCC